jgi:hypothetical protein
VGVINIVGVVDVVDVLAVGVVDDVGVTVIVVVTVDVEVGIGYPTVPVTPIVVVYGLGIEESSNKPTDCATGTSILLDAKTGITGIARATADATTSNGIVNHLLARNLFIFTSLVSSCPALNNYKLFCC